MKHILVIALLLMQVLTPTLGWAENKVTSKARQAVDPDCTVGKAAKGAAMKSTVGVGNRCGVGETARDATGVDGKGKKLKKKVSN